MRHILRVVVILSTLGVGLGGLLEAQEPRAVPGQTINTVDEDRDDGGDWGWLGLIGLIGLAGLMRRDPHDRTVVRPDTRPPTARP